MDTRAGSPSSWSFVEPWKMEIVWLISYHQTIALVPGTPLMASTLNKKTVGAFLLKSSEVYLVWITPWCPNFASRRIDDTICNSSTIMLTTSWRNSNKIGWSELYKILSFLTERPFNTSTILIYFIIYSHIYHSKNYVSLRRESRLKSYSKYRRSRMSFGDRSYP